MSYSYTLLVQSTTPHISTRKPRRRDQLRNKSTRRVLYIIEGEEDVEEEGEGGGSQIGFAISLFLNPAAAFHPVDTAVTAGGLRDVQRFCEFLAVHQETNVYYALYAHYLSVL